MRSPSWTFGAATAAGVLGALGCGAHGASRGDAAPVEVRASVAKTPSGPPRGTAVFQAAVAPLDERDLWASPSPLPRELALRKAQELLAAASGEQANEPDEAQARALAAAGFDEDVGLAVLLGLLDGCLDAEGDGCAAQIPGGDEATASFFRLLPSLARIASARTIALLARLEEQRFSFGEPALAVLEARAAKGMRAACAAPTQTEIDKEIADLGDFVVLEADHDARSGREPSPAELGDLAYFLAGIRRDRASPRAEVLDGGNEATAALASEHQAARLGGDRDAIVRVGLAYFAALGHAIEAGARPANELPDEAGPIARALGRELELRGRFGEAAVAYRKGSCDPRGGCDVAAAPYEQAMRRAIVRTEEASGDCRGAVAARLYAPDATAVDVHGPKRLQRAGWDVPRLYRGAALTMHRRELAPGPGGNDFLGPDQAERTAARLARWGNEAYDDELRALEGLADTGRLAALPLLAARVARGATFDRRRAMEALVQLAGRPTKDPCREGRVEGESERVGGGPERTIRGLNDTCRTQLTRAQRDRIVAVLVAATKDRDWEVRVEAAQAIGSIATHVPAELTGLLRDPEAPLGPGTQHRPVREAARVAIASIRAASMKKKVPLSSARPAPLVVLSRGGAPRT